MNSIDRFQAIKSKIAQAERDAERVRTKIDMLKDQLKKDFGVSTEAEVKKKKRELETALEEKQAAFDQKFSELSELVGSYESRV